MRNFLIVTSNWIFDRRVSCAVITVTGLIFYSYYFVHQLYVKEENRSYVEYPKPGKPRWIFLGDSNFGRLFRVFIELQKNCTQIKKGSRCDRDIYLGIERRAKWLRPSPIDGPTDYGLENPYCSDCYTCRNGHYECETLFIETIAVEFTRDVELQSMTTNTTQESVSLYLLNNPKDRCFVNSGMHDLKLKAVTDAIFIEHVKTYIKLIQPACKKIIWISQTSVRNTSFNNKIIKRRNYLVKNMLKYTFPTTEFLDIYEMSNRKNIHTDGVHLNTEFYRSVSLILQKYRN